MLIESLYFIYLFTNDKEVMDPGNLAQQVRNEIEAIDELIQVGKLQKIAFEREQSMLNKQALNPGLSFETFFNGLEGRVEPLEGRARQRLLNLAENLCLALDRLCHLIYCHCNNGSVSDEGAKDIKFPLNLPRRSDGELKDEFAKRHFKIKFTDEKAYDNFEKMIRDCLNEIGADGQAGCILDTLRNHGESVVIEVRQDQANRCVTFHSVQPHSRHRLPESLVKVASKLLPFVRDTRNGLLRKCFPKAPPFDEVKVQLDLNGVHIRHTLQTFDQNCFNNNFQYFV
jgi:hypothetical protein